MKRLQMGKGCGISSVITSDLEEREWHMETWEIHFKPEALLEAGGRDSGSVGRYKWRKWKRKELFRNPATCPHKATYPLHGARNPRYKCELFQKYVLKYGLGSWWQHWAWMWLSVSNSFDRVMKDYTSGAPLSDSRLCYCLNPVKYTTRGALCFRSCLSADSKLDSDEDGWV